MQLVVIDANLRSLDDPNATTTLRQHARKQIDKTPLAADSRNHDNDRTGPKGSWCRGIDGYAATGTKRFVLTCVGLAINYSWKKLNG